MLRDLRIRNLAIVEELEFEPQGGLNVLSGETGAGKSIVVQAIELLLGGKATLDLVRTGADAVRVDGTFELAGDDFFRRRGLDLDLEEGTLVIRREIARNGRSRLSVNDEPVTLARLRAIGERLADLHGQHEHQALYRMETHVDALDRYGQSLKPPASGGRLSPLDSYRLERGQWLEIEHALERLEAKAAGASDRRGALERDVADIEAARLLPDEEATLRAERQIVLNAARLIEAVGAAADELLEGEAPVTTRLAHLLKLLGPAAQIDPALGDVTASLQEALLALNEQGRALAAYRERLQFDPDRAEWIEDRLELIGRLKKRFGGTETEIAAFGAAAAKELASLSDDGARLPRLRSDLAQAEARLFARGWELAEWRRDVARRFEKAVSLELAALGMTKARFSVRQALPAGFPTEAPAAGTPPHLDASAAGEKGFDQIEFFLAANPGEDERPLARVASGGEASRLMLAIKSVLRAVDPVPILLFDEVDAGIGGLVATAVGERLAELARHRQVIVITHLPAVASRADQHFRIAKRIHHGRTVTEIARLDGGAREEELARMLAGAEAGAEALSTARALLAEVRRRR